MNFCGSHRLPRAYVDPIDDSGARALFMSVLSIPPQPESVILLLDAERCGSTMVNMAGTRHDDDIYDVAEIAAATAVACGCEAVVLASVRPGRPEDLSDAERWLDIDERFADVGVELVEWYVFGRGVTSPRELIGEAARWEP